MYDWKLIVAIVALLLALTAFLRDRTRLRLRLLEELEEPSDDLLVEVRNRGRRPVAIIDTSLVVYLDGFRYPLRPSGWWRYFGGGFQKTDSKFPPTVFSDPIILNEERPALFLHYSAERLERLRSKYRVEIVALWAVDTGHRQYVRSIGRFGWLKRWRRDAALKSWPRSRYFGKLMEVLRLDDPEMVAAMARDAINESPWRFSSDESVRKRAFYEPFVIAQAMDEHLQWRQLLRELYPEDPLAKRNEPETIIPPVGKS